MPRPASLRSTAGRLALASMLAGCGGGGSDPVEPPPPPPPPTAAVVAASSGAAAQTATVGTAVAAAPAVLVTSSAGQPMAGVAVAFAVTAGGGTLGATAATTNAQGIASAGSWTLGTTVGANAVRATVGSLAPVTFEARGTAGAVASLSVASGDGQQGWTEEALPQPVVVQTRDAHGNAVPDAAVAFATAAGSGAPSAAQVTTGANGQAQVTWTLGDVEGAQAMTASAGTAGIAVAATGAFPALTAAQLATGSGAQCARGAAGTLACWGSNTFGLVGDGTTTFRARPVAVGAAIGSFADVSLGASHGCALTMAGAAYCWGHNSGGTLGNGTTTSTTAPAPVAGGHAFTRIVAGITTTCALKADGSAWCWGGPLSGEMNMARLVPTAVSETLRFTALAAGRDEHCGVATSGGVHCWSILGVGTGPNVASRAPALVPGSAALVTITIGTEHRCGLTTAGEAFCWGRNSDGALGDGTTTNRTAPTAAAGGHRFAVLKAGRSHTCGITLGGDALCWGSNAAGQLGNGVVGNGGQYWPTPDPTAVAVPPGVRLRDIAPGGGQTCAIATTDDVLCWGAWPTNDDPGPNPLVLTPQRVRAR